MDGDSSTWLAELNSGLEQELATYPQHMKRQVMSQVENESRRMPRIREQIEVWPDGFWSMFRLAWFGKV